MSSLQRITHRLFFDYLLEWMFCGVLGIFCPAEGTHPTSGQCGRKGPVNSRINGGQGADRSKWPWMAFLEVATGGE
jgi:hypothetical protein